MRLKKFLVVALSLCLGVSPVMAHAETGDIGYDYDEDYTYDDDELDDGDDVVETVVPTKPSGIGVSLVGSELEVSVENHYNADGEGTTEVMIVNEATGKKVITGVMPFQTYKFIVPKYSLYSVYLRNAVPCNCPSGGDVHSDWTKAKYVISAPNKISYKKVSGSTVKIKWSKVKGAKSYVVYRKKSTAKKYKKVLTTSATSANFTIPRNGSQFDFKVECTAKKSGKTVKSTAVKYLRLRWVYV